jgi:hypothetical protein
VVSEKPSIWRIKPLSMFNPAGLLQPFQTHKC